MTCKTETDAGEADDDKEMVTSLHRQGELIQLSRLPHGHISTQTLFFLSVCLTLCKILTISLGRQT